MPPSTDEKVTRKYEALRRKEEEESVKLLSQKYKLPYIDLFMFPIEVDAIKTLPEEKARTGNLAVFQRTGKILKIGVQHPDKEETKAALKRLESDRYIHELYLISRHSLEHAWEFYKKVPEEYKTAAGVIEIAHEYITTLRQEITNLSQIRAKIETTFYSRATDALEIILAGAIAVDASDVHLEPQPDTCRIRFRLDGVLMDIINIPLKLYQRILSRIKLISELKLNIHEKAQDGRFTIHDSIDIEVRTSTLPGPAGENVVLRILNPKTIAVPFEELGMQPWIIAVMEHELVRPNGMILTTGPTGSGKTTTLYAFLRKIHTPDLKIITLEDPIEYRVPGTEQTRVDAKKGYDFANGLRSILRHDPDVILIGEIRDLETAETAMHASMTGHLVLSTLHTNNAAGTIPRLIDLGVRPSIIAPAINVSMAQRLVRKLCAACRQAVKPDKKLIARIEKELSAFPKNVPIPPPDAWTIFRAAEKGCSACNNTGYKGRNGIFEIILIGEEAEHLILKEPSEYEIKKMALGQGQINMQQDGLLKILAGITDFEELKRVVGE